VAHREIAFADRGIDIIRTALLRECHHGDLTGHPAVEIAAVRARCVSEPFPGGESYADMVRRVREFLSRARGERIVVVGHGATLYALRHLLDGAPLSDVVAAAWQWQPGWRFHVDRLSA